MELFCFVAEIGNFVDVLLERSVDASSVRDWVADSSCVRPQSWFVCGNCEVSSAV